MIVFTGNEEESTIQVFFQQRASIGEREQKIRIRKMALELRAESVIYTSRFRREVCTRYQYQSICCP